MSAALRSAVIDIGMSLMLRRARLAIWGGRTGMSSRSVDASGRSPDRRLIQDSVSEARDLWRVPSPALAGEGQGEGVGGCDDLHPEPKPVGRRASSTPYGAAPSPAKTGAGLAARLSSRAPGARLFSGFVIFQGFAGRKISHRFSYAAFAEIR